MRASRTRAKSPSRVRRFSSTSPLLRGASGRAEMEKLALPRTLGSFLEDDARAPAGRRAQRAARAKGVSRRVSLRSSRMGPYARVRRERTGPESALVSTAIRVLHRSGLYPSLPRRRGDWSGATPPIAPTELLQSSSLYVYSAFLLPLASETREEFLHALHKEKSCSAAVRYRGAGFRCARQSQSVPGRGR